MKDWAIIKQIKPENIEYYRMLSGIYGIAKDFRFAFLPTQKRLVEKLYKSMTAMNIKWLKENEEVKSNADHS